MTRHLGKIVWRVGAPLVVVAAALCLSLPILSWHALSSPWSFALSVFLGLVGGGVIELCVDKTHPDSQARLRYSTWLFVALIVVVLIGACGAVAFIGLLSGEAVHSSFAQGRVHAYELLPRVRLDACYLWFLWGFTWWWLGLCVRSRRRAPANGRLRLN